MSLDYGPSPTPEEAEAAAARILANPPRSFIERVEVSGNPVPDPLASPCPSCGAKAGEPCRSTTGEELYEPHYTRGAPA